MTPCQGRKIRQVGSNLILHCKHVREVTGSHIRHDSEVTMQHGSPCIHFLLAHPGIFSGPNIYPPVSSRKDVTSSSSPQRAVPTKTLAAPHPDDSIAKSHMY